MKWSMIETRAKLAQDGDHAPDIFAFFSYAILLRRVDEEQILLLSTSERVGHLCQLARDSSMGLKQ